MTRDQLADWIAAYERLWRTAGTDGLGELFAEDVAYKPGPFVAPVQGLAALRGFWEAEREGADEAFSMTAGVVAVDGDTGVARIDVVYGTGDRWLDLWIVVFDAQDRCVAFEEWPIAP